MIRVTKRDGVVEPLRVERLRLCLWRVLRSHPHCRTQADNISRAIVLHLRRTGVAAVSSRALFEMTLRCLRHTNHDAAADALERHARWRQNARRAMTIVHDDTHHTAWDRSWVTQQIQRRWDIGRPAARAISSQIEGELLGRRSEISRDAAVDLLDERVENYGLAPWCLLASASA
jgi:hypothetical protein